MDNLELESNELAHHGVKGMKWGVRKDKRKDQRQLNKIVKESDKELGKALYYAAKAERTKNPRKQEAYINKSYAASKKSKEKESELWKATARVIEKGSHVSASNITRNTQKGRDFMNTALGVSLVGLPVTAVMGGVNPASMAVTGAVVGGVKEYTLQKRYKEDYAGQSPYNVSTKKYRVR